MTTSMQETEKNRPNGIVIIKAGWYDFVKRCFDIVFSLSAIIVLLPIFIVLSILIKLFDNGSIFYISDRVGRNGKVFRFYKFRSMCENADHVFENIKGLNETTGSIFKMKDDPRVTRIGRFLRRTSLDELPQLFNILKGDMSFVGPRPPLVREVQTYDDNARKRLAVKGGLTCYWQISGRSNLGFDEMVKLDVKYINERGIWTDIKIVLKTIPAVFRGDGAY